MSSPLMIHNGSTKQRSSMPSSELNSSPSFPLQSHIDRTPPATSRVVDAHVHNGTNGHIHDSPKQNGSPISKRGSIGRAGGFLLAPTQRAGVRHEQRILGPSRGREYASDHGGAASSTQYADVRTTNTKSRMPPSIARPDPHDRDLIEQPRFKVDPTHHDLVPAHSSMHINEALARGRLQSTALDPSQIVSMALNLSEGRRRNISGAAPVSMSSPRGPSSATPTLPRPYSQAASGSLKKHLQDQRRVARQSTPDTSNNAVATEAVVAAFSSTEMDLAHQHRVSAATLARTEKARQHFELSSQYRRLLATLPPLRSSRIESSSTYANGLRQGKEHDRTNDATPLGRDYNPLQLIRNRKTRARARRSLNPAPETWGDSPAVDDWLNVVENVAHGSHFVRGDLVMLPRYPPKQHEHLTSSQKASDDGFGSIATKSSRPRLDWFISPTELLADAYWLEQDGNKTVIEDRQGSRLYTTISASDDPRLSIESRHSHQGSSHAPPTSEKAHDSEPETYLESRGRRRNTQQESANGDGSGRIKQAWHKARRRSPSSSSDILQSDGDTSKRIRPNRIRPGADYLNTGPLERHLNRIIDQQGLTSATQTPELLSRDISKDWEIDSRQVSNASTSPESKMVTDREISAKTIHEVESTKSRASTSHPKERVSLDHYSPSSPITNKLFVRSSTDIHQYDHGKPSPTRKKHFFSFHKTDTKDSRKAETGRTIQDDSDISSQRQSEDPKVRHSQENHYSPIKDQKLHLDTQFITSSNNLASSPNDFRTREGESAVRRFFKGGMIGRRRDDAAADRRDKTGKDTVDEDHLTTDGDGDSMEESDTEDTSGTGGLKRRDTDLRTFRRTNTSGLEHLDSSASRRKDKRQYHLDLPKFRPSGHEPSAVRPFTPDQEKRANDFLQSEQGDMSPMYNLQSATPADSYTSLVMVQSNGSMLGSPEQALHRPKRGILSHIHSRAQSKSTNQRSAITIDESKAIDAKSKNAASSKAVSALRDIHSPSLVPPFPQHHNTDRRRHWSISDADVRRSSVVFQAKASSTMSYADIAHVRALLICTGVKAATLARRSQGGETCPSDIRAHKDRIPAPPTSCAAIRASAQQISIDLDTESKMLHDSVNVFRNNTVAPLHESLRKMRLAVGDCAERARSAGDEAVGFGALVTGQKTIEVRQVLDQMEKFRRKRRRRLRLLRRIGFGLLEWGVLFIMWLVWFVVVIFKTIWGVVKGTVRVGRWALWL